MFFFQFLHFEVLDVKHFNITKSAINRGMYMCAQFFIECIKLWKEINAMFAGHFISFFATSLINQIIQEHKC